MGSEMCIRDRKRSCASKNIYGSNSFGQCMSMKSLEQKYFTIFCRYSLVLATHLRSGNDMRSQWGAHGIGTINLAVSPLVSPCIKYNTRTGKSENFVGHVSPRMRLVTAKSQIEKNIRKSIGFFPTC